jgi:hypothetical protein
MVFCLHDLELVSRPCRSADEPDFFREFSQRCVCGRFGRLPFPARHHRAEMSSVQCLHHYCAWLPVDETDYERESDLYISVEGLPRFLARDRCVEIALVGSNRAPSFWLRLSPVVAGLRRLRDEFSSDGFAAAAET